MVELARFKKETPSIANVTGRVAQGLRGAVSGIAQRTGIDRAAEIAAFAAAPVGAALRDPGAVASAVAAPFRASIEAQTAQRSSSLRPRIFAQPEATQAAPPNVLATSHGAVRTPTTLQLPVGPTEPGPEVAPIDALTPPEIPEGVTAPALAEQPTGLRAPVRTFESTPGFDTRRAVPVQRPVFEFQQVTDPVTGRDNPQKVDTGQTKTVWIGPDGGEFDTEADAYAGRIALQEAASQTGLRAAQATQATATAGQTTAETAEVAANAASLRAYREAQTGETQARTAEAGAKAKAPVVKSIKVDSGRTDALGAPVQETMLSIAVPGQEPQVVRPRDLFTPTQAQRELTRLYANLSATQKELLAARVEGRDDLDVYSSLDAVYDAGALEE